jgi:type IV secretion system protein VirD4
MVTAAAVMVLMAAVALWTVAASMLFVWLGHLGLYYRTPLTTWWTYALQPGMDKWTHLYLGLTGGVAAIPILAVLGLLAWVCRPSRKKLRPTTDGKIRPTEPGVTDNHGHSRWLTMKEAQELFPGPDPTYGGIVVGEAYRVDQDPDAKCRFSPRDKSTWGMGGKAPLLIDPCHFGSTHSLVFGGPGSYKSTSAVSTILHWTGSSVILDPSRELGPMLDEALRAQGKRVFHISIATKESRAAIGLDIFQWIDIEDPEAEKHIMTVVGWIYDEEAVPGQGRTSDPFFTDMGRMLITALLAHMLYDDTLKVKTAASLASAFAISESLMPNVLRQIARTSKSPLARRFASQLCEARAPETFAGIYSSAMRGCAWLSIETYADVLSQLHFNAKDLLNGDTTVFLNISLQTMENTPEIARVMVGSILNSVYQADGNLEGRVLFLLDEAARLGRMKILQTARDAGRKYGITLQLLLQSTGQLRSIWGADEARAWFDAMSFCSYASVRAGAGGKDLSDQLGTYGVLAYSEGDNKGSQRQWGRVVGNASKGTNTSVHEIKRLRMSPAELQQDLRADEIIVVPAEGMPIRCGRAIYFRRPEIVEQVTTSRFARSVA